MRSFYAAIAACGTLLCSMSNALAQADLSMVGDTVVSPQDAAYPAGLAARGVQGRVVVAVKANAQGSAASVAIRESSRSRELDKAALALARSYPYAPPNKGEAPGEVLVPIRFSKDNVSNVRTKTCADLNVDRAYFTATFPDKKTSDMPAVTLAMDLLIFTLPGPQQAPYERQRDAVAAAAIAACASRPNEKFFALMQQEAAKLPQK